MGDTSGFRLYTARENKAFAWESLATLTDSTRTEGPWTGEVCVTGSGRYAVAVYAPSAAVNRPATFNAGATAAVVEISTGHAKVIATDVQLAYFDPSCGPGDSALLTRGIGADGQKTDLLTVDAAAGRVTKIRRIAAQLTTPAATADGDYGIAHGALVRVDDHGVLTTVAHPAGRPYALVPVNSGIDIASVTGRDSVLQRFQTGRLTQLATGPFDRLQLFPLADGHDALVGAARVTNPKSADILTLGGHERASAVSRQGHLVLETMLTAQAAHAAADPLMHPQAKDAGTVRVTVRATHSGHTSSATVKSGTGPVLNTATAGRRSGPASVLGPTAPSLTDANITDPTCAVPRNDPHVQALQPSPNMVEWAIDQVVHGNLTVSRPANYLKTGQASYTPQGMFPLHSVYGGGHVPAQVMLGIAAQESNLNEASFHAVPGDTGNPLIADYYGNGNNDIEVIDYNNSDCGYGIGQVTTGMHVGELPYNQQVAIATDYAANLAAAVNILIDKWNQTRTDSGGSWVNDGSANYIENWYLALWAYNSGFHPSSEASQNGGHWGVGWLNNPANPVYPADRQGFLRNSYADAETPNQWAYEERVLGWAETPQIKGDGDAYAKPDFGSSSGEILSLPGYLQFCSTNVNNCDPSTPAGQDPCPAESELCWWHGTTTWTSCSTACATEYLTFTAGTAEPAIDRIYPQSCSYFDPNQDFYFDGSGKTRVVYDLQDTGGYALGCSPGASDGKFTLRLGYEPGRPPYAYYSAVDLHQVGAGYMGHIWFTHVYPEDYAGDDYNRYHQVTGTWTPDITSSTPESYDIVVHLPSHGGEYANAEYVVFSDGSDNNDSCVINQDTSPWYSDTGVDKWVYLGSYNLSRGARVQLKNVAGINSADGTTDIAFDAMAFVPTMLASNNGCGKDY